MKLVITVALSILTTLTYSQEIFRFDSPKWRFENQGHKIENYLGKESLVLTKNRAFVDVQFENGIIEYDVAFPQQRAFIAVMFRMQDDENYEEFYLRAHQSGNPDANQYSPVYHGISGWQLYYGEGYGTPVNYQFNQWQHVKLAISGKYMDVYINDMNNPVMFCELKREPKKGYLGLSNFNNENHFADFKVLVSNDVQLKGTPKPKTDPPSGTVMTWQVSDPFDEKILSANDLTAVKRDKWKSAAIESSGTLNLASVAKFTPETQAVLAKVTITSDRDQLKKLTFGFSDRVKVFCNNTILYSGEDEFLSRDYRYLGTIGYFDAVYLPLKKGSNEIVFAVAENFGGWGIKAKFDDLNGIGIK